jgi:hypothetical protein
MAKEMLEDTKEVICSIKLRDREYNGQRNVRRYQRGNLKD